MEDLTEEELEDDDEYLFTCSPEPPEPLGLEDITQTDEHSQPGRLHPEQDLPHIFKVSTAQFLFDFIEVTVGG